jgi:large subunit ribosomal protein L18
MEGSDIQMITKTDKNKARLKRHLRVRKKIEGTAERPRLNIFRSSKHMYAQIIDDTKGVTLVAASTNDKDLKGDITNGGNIEAARKVGETIAKLAKEKGIEAVVFDRGGYIYHGRVQALADGAREAGLDF